MINIGLHFTTAKIGTLLLFAFMFCGSMSANAANISAESLQRQEQAAPVHLYFYWSSRCDHCLRAKPFVASLAAKYPWLKVHSYDLFDNRVNVNRYINMAREHGMSASSVPGFIFCGQMMIGYSVEQISGRELETKLLACRDNAVSSAETFAIPWLGQVHFRDYSLPVFTILIAALDAFNPCAFFVLFFLLSLIAQQRSRLRIAMIGGTFVLFSGVMYFIFMAAWLNLFLLTEQLTFITAVAGLIAIIAGLINIKDYFFFKQGVSLSIPDAARPNLFQRMRSLTQAGRWPAMLGASMILAIAANSYELLCTAGLPMVFTRVLTLNELSNAQYYLYLLLYNLVYILPLLLIVTVFTFTLGSRKLSEREGRLLKLLSGSMMLGLGGILFFAPELLTHLYASLAVLGIAVGLTVFIALLEKKVTDSV